MAGSGAGVAGATGDGVVVRLGRGLGLLALANARGDRLFDRRRAAWGGPLWSGVQGMGGVQGLEALDERRPPWAATPRHPPASVLDSAASSWLRRSVRASRYAAWAKPAPSRAS